MDTKVIIEVVCPHCHSKIMMKKYKEITSKIIKCPGNGCGKELNIQFDTTKDPQTYIIIEEATQKEQNKTIYKRVSIKKMTNRIPRKHDTEKINVILHITIITIWMKKMKIVQTLKEDIIV